jgi:hypothetical protein
MKRKDAYQVLEEFGLIPLTFWVVHDDYSYGDVTDIEPGIGKLVLGGTEIVLDVVGEIVKNKDHGSTEDEEVQCNEISGSGEVTGYGIIEG